MRILFVCTGNLCRSPFAEGYLRKRLAEGAGSTGDAVQVGSAGTMAASGAPALDESLATALKWGVDLAGHRTRQVGEALLEGADLLLVMDRSHLEVIRALWPSFGEKVRFLGEFDPAAGRKGREIEDPYGGPARGYRRCYQRIARAVDGLLEELTKKG